MFDTLGLGETPGNSVLATTGTDEQNGELFCNIYSMLV